MKDNNLDEKQSLAIINGMIAEARNNMQKGMGNTIIVSGYTVAFVAIANYILLQVLDEPRNAYWLWLLMIPMGILNFGMGRRRYEKAIVKTHIDKIIGGVWTGYGSAITILLTILFFSTYLLPVTHAPILITPIILTFTGFAQYITAVSCRFKPYYWSALVFAIAALLCLLSYYFQDFSLQFIILAIAFLIGFALPGHTVNKMAKQHV